MIYFVGNIEMNVCKIGWTNNLKRRICVLKKSVPFDIQVYRTEKGNAYEESLYHNIFASNKIHGEWFNISKEEALSCSILSYYKSIKINNHELTVDPNTNAIYKRDLFEMMIQENFIFMSNSIDHLIIAAYEKLGIKRQKDKKWINYNVFIEIVKNINPSFKIYIYDLIAKRLKL